MIKVELKNIKNVVKKRSKMDRKQRYLMEFLEKAMWLPLTKRVMDKRNIEINQTLVVYSCPFLDPSLTKTQPKMNNVRRVIERS